MTGEKSRVPEFPDPWELLTQIENLRTMYSVFAGSLFHVIFTLNDTECVVVKADIFIHNHVFSIIITAFMFRSF